MAKNQKKITIASFNYLLEFSAIPEKTRTGYLDSLLNRKNASSQKNIQLLRMIYEIVEGNKIHQWDPDSLSKTLSVSMDTLYKHKSRLLKGLKKYYLGWKNKEKETAFNIKYLQSRYEDEERYFRINMDKALKMGEAGMRKEAKLLMLSLEKKLLNSSVDKKFKYLTLAHIYERLIVYYTIKTDKARVLYFFDRLKETAEEAAKFDLTEKEKIFLNIWLYYGSYTKDHNQFHKRYNRAKINFYLSKVYNEAVKINAHDYILRALNGLAAVEGDLRNSSKAEKYCIKGYELSSKFGNDAAKYSFVAMLNLARARQNKRPMIYKPEEIIEYYKRLKNARPLDAWASYLEHSCAIICSLEKIKGASAFYRARINSNILTGGHTYAAYLLFNLECENYYKRISASFEKNEEGFISTGKIDGSLLDYAENTCLTTLHYNRVINDMGFIWDIYQLQLVTYFFREEDFDYDKALNIIKKMEHLIRNKRKVSGLESFEMLKLGLKMLEYSDNRVLMLKRYEYKFKKQLDNFMNNPTEINDVDYAIVSSLARRLQIKEITNIVKFFYQWLQSNHPEILAPVLRELEEKNTKVYTVIGKEQSAA